MKTSKVIATLAFVISVLISVFVYAHHSTTPHFDSSQQVYIKNATVVEWKFVNPHSYLYFDVTSNNGEIINWRCESSAATVLRRVGWTKETIRPGQKVTIRGDAARREANVCSFADSVEKLDFKRPVIFGFQKIEVKLLSFPHFFAGNFSFKRVFIIFRLKQAHLSQD